jgi:hypothetical protein
VEANGESQKLIQMNDDDTATLFLPNGKTSTVSLDANGMLAARQLLDNSTLYAFN